MDSKQQRENPETVCLISLNIEGQSITERKSLIYFVSPQIFEKVRTFFKG